MVITSERPNPTITETNAAIKIALEGINYLKRHSRPVSSHQLFLYLKVFSRESVDGENALSRAIDILNRHPKIRISDDGYCFNEKNPPRIGNGYFDGKKIVYPYSE